MVSCIPLWDYVLAFLSIFYFFFTGKKFGGLIFLVLNLHQFFKITYSERWRDMALRNLDNLLASKDGGKVSTPTPVTRRKISSDK